MSNQSTKVSKKMLVSKLKEVTNSNTDPELVTNLIVLLYNVYTCDLKLPGKYSVWWRGFWKKPLVSLNGGAELVGLIGKLSTASDKLFNGKYENNQLKLIITRVSGLISAFVNIVVAIATKPDVREAAMLNWPIYNESFNKYLACIQKEAKPQLADKFTKNEWTLKYICQLILEEIATNQNIKKFFSEILPLSIEQIEESFKAVIGYIDEEKSSVAFMRRQPKKRSRSVRQKRTRKMRRSRSKVNYSRRGLISPKYRSRSRRFRGSRSCKNRVIKSKRT